MRILVTGGTGFVGSHAAAALAREGHRLRLLARAPEKVARVLGPLGAGDVEVAAGDVGVRADVEAALDGCDAVLHAAALLSFDRKRVPEMERTNVQGTRFVLEGARARGLDPIGFVSSAAALAEPEGTPLTERSPLTRARDPYSRTKAEAEAIARALQDGGAPVVTFYPGGVWGPYNPTLGPQITTILAMVEAGYYIHTAGGAPLIDVRDLTLGIVRALTPGRGARRFMLSGRFRTHAQMRRDFMEATGRWLLPVPIPAALLRLAGRIGDFARDRLGFDPGAITLESMQIATSGVRGDDRRALEALGLTLRPTPETFRDQLAWMVAAGLIEARHAGRAANARIAVPYASDAAARA